MLTWLPLQAAGLDQPQMPCKMDIILDQPGWNVSQIKLMDKLSTSYSQKQGVGELEIGGELAVGDACATANRRRRF